MCVLRDNHALNACKMYTSAGNSPSLSICRSLASKLSLCVSILLGPSLVLVLSLTLNSVWLLKKAHWL